MKVHLHIGQQKTGSTSIQKFFEINRKALSKQGYLYPKSLGVDKQVGLFKQIDDLLDPSSQVYKSFFKEIEKSKCEHLILSEENLFTLKDELLDKVGQFLNSHFQDISIIAYLRRQYDQAASLYQEVVKGRVFLKYEAWIEKKLNQGYYNYTWVLERWENRFPEAKMKVKAFYNLLENDIRKDILNEISFPNIEKLNFNEAFNFKNTGIDTLSIEILRVSNAFVKKGNPKDPEAFRAKVRKYVFGKTFDKKLVLHYAQKERLWNEFLASNQALINKYQLSEDEYFLDKPKEEDGWTNDDHDPEEVLLELSRIYNLSEG
ncbi:MAG: hypothetical protein HKO66_13860 [Saprospiraceae bacterium]|nr:hypothetical protein [Bacteroidia bacterium]NNE14516.1 hypothetical protein [Saprospiraceae bacterium]NNL93321.1 hypothetical protein [Saprospiraceae bacterium]